MGEYLYSPQGYDYEFHDSFGPMNKGRVMVVNTGGRAVTGADVESLARTQKGDFVHQIFVPAFGYWHKPIETVEKEKNMSVTMWCDIDDSATNYPNQVGHPFPSRDKKRRNMSFTEYDDNGDAHTIQGDICGYHADRNPFFNPNAAKAISASSKAEDAKAKGYDPEYVKWLEERNGVGTSDQSED